MIEREESDFPESPCELGFPVRVGPFAWIEHDSDKPSQVEADVAVFSAAPELFAACKNLENDDGSIPEHAWLLVQSAIASAKGER